MEETASLVVAQRPAVAVRQRPVVAVWQRIVAVRPAAAVVLQRPAAVSVPGLSWLAQGQGSGVADSVAEPDLEVAVASGGLTAEPGWVAFQSYFQAVVHGFEMGADFDF